MFITIRMAARVQSTNGGRRSHGNECESLAMSESVSPMHSRHYMKDETSIIVVQKEKLNIE